MGRKGRWFDTVQRILSTSEPDPVETHADAKQEKPTKLRDKPSFKKIWQFGKSNASSAASTSAPPALDVEAHQLPQSPITPDNKQHVEEITGKVQFLETGCKEGEPMRPTEVVSSPAGSKVDSTSAAMAAAAVVGRPTVISSPTWSARSKEDIAATRIQAACRGHLARRPQQERGMARLMRLVNKGYAVKRQTAEALYCMQMMTRIQTQIYSRRLKTDEDKKALKSQPKVKQSLDKTKNGEGWDHSLQSKEQMEAVVKMKQEAATRRQRALSYAFSQQWRNRNTSSARAAHAPAPMFMDPGNPNWGWSWTERWMAAARPWENQTTTRDISRVASKTASRPLPRVAMSMQIPAMTNSPKGKAPFRPPSWPSSLSSPSTPPLRSSPLISAKTTTMLASPRSGPLQHTKSMPLDRRPRSGQELLVNSPRRAVPVSPRGSGSGSPLRTFSSGGVQRATTTQLERRPRSSQELSVNSPRRAVTPASPRGAGSSSPLRTSTSGGLERRPRSSQELSVNSPRRAVPASPRATSGSRSSSPRHTSSSGGAQHATTMQLERRPRSSQDRGMSSSPRLGANDNPLCRTTSLRAELPRKLSLGSSIAAASASMGDDEGAPVTPSYMQPTKSLKAKVVRSPSPSAAMATSSDMFDAAESSPAPPQQQVPPSPSSAKKRLPQAFADKPSASSPSKVALERVRRHSQLSSPRMSLS